MTALSIINARIEALRAQIERLGRNPFSVTAYVQAKLVLDRLESYRVGLEETKESKNEK